MSATTPTTRGAAGTPRLGAMLVAIALAIVLIVAVVALQAMASRPTTADKAPLVAVPAFDRGFAAKRGPTTRSPYAVPGDHGWIAEGGQIATPQFAVPGDHAAATDGSSVAPVLLELPRPFDPSSLSGSDAPVGGGRGTRMAR